MVDNPRTRRPIDYYLLWAVALVSLGLNLYLINSLMQARKQVAQAVSQAAVAVGTLRGVAFDLQVPISQTLSVRQTLPIRQTLPVSFTVVIQQTFSVPISVTLPIDTQVTVSLNTPIGTFPINVPVKTTVPINLNPQVPLNLSVPVSITLPVSFTVPVAIAVPVSFTVPIHLALGDTSLGGSLDSAVDYLNNVAADLSGAGPMATPTP